MIEQKDPRYENSNAYSENNVKEEEGKTWDLKFLWFLFLRYRYWVLVSMIACCAVGWLYLHYVTPMYQVYSKILIKDQERRPYSGSSINNTFMELGFMNNSNGFDNEIEVLSSRTLNKEVVRQMKLYVSYSRESRMRTREFYGKYSPYLVDIDPVDLDALPSSILVELSPIEGGLQADVHYSKPGESKLEKYILTKQLHQFPATIYTELGKLTVEKNPMLSSMKVENAYVLDGTLSAVISPIDAVASSYVGKLSVAATSKMTTIAKVTMTDNLPERARDYLSMLAYVYNEDANKDNNEEGERTAKFINERLDIISRELSTTEAELEQMKRDAGVLDVSSNVASDMTQNIQYENKLVDATTQLNLLEYISEYVNSPANHLQIIPSNVGLQNTNLVSVIAQYNALVSDRNRLLRNTTEDAPAVQQLTMQAEDLLVNIKGSIMNARRQLTIQRNDIQSQYSKYNSRISSAPSKERALGDISRQKEVKAGLYLMLLQKREENAITLASAAYKGKVIEEPIAFPQAIWPIPNTIYIVCLLIGFLLPFGFHYFRMMFRYRIENRDDLARLTKIPLLGSIPYVKALVKGDRTVVIQENKNSIMMEVYRTLRSNLPFILSKGQNVILFTSCTSGEGKTVIASNLGASIAFVGKRVLVMGLDIRKPRLAGLFGLHDTEKGISNFLSHDPDDVAYLDKLVQKSGISDNLDILPAGPIPPNPAELLERDNLKIAIDYFRDKYDYILLDTAPIGMVADTLSIAKCADATLFVVRANYTLKADADLINEMGTDGRLPNVNILFNAVKEGGAGGYSSRYGYSRRYYSGYYGRGRGYGYGYAGYGGYGGYGYGNKGKDKGYGYGYGDQKLDEV